VIFESSILFRANYYCIVLQLLMSYTLLSTNHEAFWQNTRDRMLRVTPQFYRYTGKVCPNDEPPVSMARQRPKGRPSRGGAGRHAQQYKLNVESVQKKLAVITHLANGALMKNTIAHFYSNLASYAYNSKRTSIYRWARSHSSLEAALAEGKGEHFKVRSLGVGTILSQDSESEIAQWVKELRGDGIPVSTVMLTEKALEVAETSVVEDFKASDKWMVGFKRRFMLSLRAPTRQSPVNINVIAADFAALVEATVRNLGIKHVYNADQTGIAHFTLLQLFRKLTPIFALVLKLCCRVLRIRSQNKTLNKRGKKTVWVNDPTERAISI
jgi:hypothetical protein